MKHAVLLVALLALFVLSIVTEPLPDVIDTVAGATNPTFNPTIDDLAGVSDDEDDDEDDDEWEEEDDD